jgi:hypothetical protein
MPKPLPEKLEKALASVRLLGFAFIAGIALLTMAATFVAFNIGPLMKGDVKQLSHIVFGAAFCFLLVGFAIGNSLKKAKLKPGPDGFPTAENFSTGHVLAFALLEGPAIIGVLGLLMTGFLGCLVVPIVAIFLMVFNIPSRESLAQY